MPTRSRNASKGECKGKPPRHKHRGGIEGQLRKLRKGIHPNTGAALPPPVELDPVAPPIRRTVEEDEHTPPDGFYEYVPIILPRNVTSNSGGGPSTAERREALLERIKANERTMNTDAAL